MKKEKHVVISKGNIKLGQIQSVSLPPVVTCSPLACKFCGEEYQELGLQPKELG